MYIAIRTCLATNNNAPATQWQMHYSLCTLWLYVLVATCMLSLPLTMSSLLLLCPSLSLFLSSLASSFILSLLLHHSLSLSSSLSMSSPLPLPLFSGFFLHVKDLLVLNISFFLSLAVNTSALLCLSLTLCLYSWARGALLLLCYSLLSVAAPKNKGTR